MTIKVEIQLIGHDDDPIKEDSWEDRDIRTMRQWLYDSLRREECRPAHLLLSILNDGVYEQAYGQGWDNAGDDNWTLTEYAPPLWKDGYERGWAERMSEKERI